MFRGLVFQSILERTPVLPDYYTVVEPRALVYDVLFCQTVGGGNAKPIEMKFMKAVQDELKWVEYASSIVQNGSWVKETDSRLIFSGYFSFLAKNEVLRPNAEFGILPLFPKKSHIAL